MKRFATATALLALLAACDDEQPFDFPNDAEEEEVVTAEPEAPPAATPTTDVPIPPGVDEDPTNPDGDPPVDGVPAGIAGDLKGAAFNAAAETLTVSISLDADANPATYIRADGTVGATPEYADGTAAVPDYDVAGYTAFVAQDDPLDAYYTAYGAESADGSAKGVLAVEGGQFLTYFGGVTYSATGFIAPDTGLATYAGDYIGMTNFSIDAPTAPGGFSGGIVPGRAVRITGLTVINADFTDNTMRGQIFNRQVAIGDDGSALGAGGTSVEDVFFVPTSINENGDFIGVVWNPDQDSVGTYAGVFGGNNGAAVAGGVRLEGDFISAVDGEEEYGLFVLNQCGQGGTTAICTVVEDVDE